MKSKNLDDDLQDLGDMIEECSGMAQKNKLYFLEYLLGMARMELSSLTAGLPADTDQSVRRVESG